MRYTRSPSLFSDSSRSPSFFRTTAPRKPRTQCDCQPVECMIAAMVAPLVVCNLAEGGNDRLWHEASVRCDAPIRSLSDVKRTWRAHRERVDATRLTQPGH